MHVASDGGECILPYAHHGPHLFRNADGKFVSWEAEWCGECPIDECDCFIYGFVTEEDATTLVVDSKTPPS